MVVIMMEMKSNIRGDEMRCGKKLIMEHFEDFDAAERCAMKRAGKIYKNILEGYDVYSEAEE